MLRACVVDAIGPTKPNNVLSRRGSAERRGDSPTPRPSVSSVSEPVHGRSCGCRSSGSAVDRRRRFLVAPHQSCGPEVTFFLVASLSMGGTSMDDGKVEQLC